MLSWPRLLISGVLAAVSTAQYDYLGSACQGSICDNGMQCLSVNGGSCSIQDPAEVLCTCGGVGGVLDPFFSGFSGQQFYFPAEAGKYYNLFSEKDHLLNAYFQRQEFFDEEQSSDFRVHMITDDHESSIISAVGLRHGSTKVEVSCDRYGDIKVLLNGEKLYLDLYDPDSAIGEALKMGDGIVLKLRPEYSQQLNVTLETSLLRVAVVADPPFVDNLTGVGRGHLDVQVDVKARRKDGLVAHGVLGQTVNASLVEQQGRLISSGSPSDHEVSDLFASDFAFNLFGQSSAPSATQKLQQPIRSARRQLKGNVESMADSLDEQLILRAETLRKVSAQ